MVFFAGVAALVVSAAEPLRLDQALSLAVAKTQAENARMELARSQLRLLEAQSKWKLELRPALGLFSFSNPALLAASVGSNLAMQRFSAPSPLAMEGAKFDVLAAEVASERLRVDTEIATARAFFDLLERQQVAGMIARSLGQLRRAAADLHQLVSNRRLTAVDEVGVEEQLLDLEQQLADVEDQRRLASIQLAGLLGQPERAGTLVAAEETLHPVAGGADVPRLEDLLEKALAARPELILVRRKLAELGERRLASRPVRIESLTGGYAYVTDAPGLSGNGVKGMLGGNTGRGEITLAVPLRKTGEKEAGEAVLAARANVLSLEIRHMEEQLRTELAAARSRVLTAAARVDIARRRAGLAEKHSAMIAARVDAGLASPPEAIQAGQSLLRARAELAKCKGIENATRFALAAVSGMRRDGTARVVTAKTTD